jgi:tetratricopeptide (TPR) repeat protein
MKPKDLLSGFVYRLKNVPGAAKRFRMWLFLILFVFLLLAVGQFVPLFTMILRGIGRVLAPVLDSKIGRFVVVNVVVFAVAYFVYRRFRERGKKLVGSYALDRFLSGLLHLAAGRYRPAARSFERVVRVGRYVKLADAVEIYPEIHPDARIKLALCYRELGEVEKAMRSLELLKVADLSPAMKKEHAEAKAFVYSLSRDLMDETIDREIDGALELSAANRRLLALKRERAEERGDLPGAIDAQKRIVKATPSSERGDERSRLAALHGRNAARLRREGNETEALAEISRSRASDGSIVLAHLLAGDVEADRGNYRAAIREWARAPSLPALERIRRLLADGRITDESDLAYLTEAFPRAGVLLLLGEHWLAEGKLRKARNCVRKYEELGLGNRHSAHLLAKIERAAGDDTAATASEWRALKGFLGADASESR